MVSLSVTERLGGEEGVEEWKCIVYVCVCVCVCVCLCVCVLVWRCRCSRVTAGELQRHEARSSADLSPSHSLLHRSLADIICEQSIRERDKREREREKREREREREKRERERERERRRRA